MEPIRNEAIKKLGELIKEIKTAMMTSIDHGILRSRPMATQDTEFDGDLWFFTGLNNRKTHEIEDDNRVNLSYSDPGSTTYVSVSGRASIVRDRARIDAYWNPIYKAWFPEGKDDPNLVLLKVEVEQAEYWDYSSGTLVQIAGFIQSIFTGERASSDDPGNKKINL